MTAPKIGSTRNHFRPPKGNQFWRLRSSHGRKPIFADGEALWEACAEYFDWIAANPLYELRAFCHGGQVITATIPKMRAMTVTGLIIWLDISMQAWSEYRRRPGYEDVCQRVYEVIQTQKFQGAAADLMNANFIARDLGMADKTELTGKDGGPIEQRVSHDPLVGVDTSQWGPEDWRSYRALIAKGASGGTVTPG